jgi:recombination protein RecA
MFGSPETTPGGRALKFYSSIRLDVRKQEAIKINGEVMGTKTKVKVVKNKVAPPFREAIFDIVYGEGISNEGCVLDLAVEMDIVDKSGAWFSYNGQKIGQGRENAKVYLKSNLDIMKEIEAKVKENYSIAFEKSMGEIKEAKLEEKVEVEE